MDALEAIHSIAMQDPSIEEDKILGEVSDYRSKEMLFSKAFVWNVVDHTSPTSWWGGICASLELSKIASNILKLPPTSAAVERSFSRHSNIHSAKRNRLTTERAAKLVYIGHNITLQEMAPSFGSVPSTSFSSSQATPAQVAAAAQPSTSELCEVSEDSIGSESDSVLSDAESLPMVNIVDEEDSEDSEVEFSDEDES